MKRRVTGTVEAILEERDGAQEIVVRVIEENSPATASASRRRAVALTELTGNVVVGDKVTLNTVAVELGLGTGGRDFVVAVARNVEPDNPTPGHILKLRYTPLQTPVLAVESPESPHHDALRGFDNLEELPVVCAQLHSQLPAIVAGARWALDQHGTRPAPRIAYIMTDGAALPLALSRIVAQMRQSGWLAATITAGQAFGGDYECVNLYSALATAHTVVRADMAVVCQGPGNVGTGTPLGFSGIEQGQAINAVTSLGGAGVACARVSFADARSRHRGLSHHTVTVLRQIALASVLVALPRLSGEEMQDLLDALKETTIEEKHQPVFLTAEGALALLDASGLNVTTMGRDTQADRAFFLSACAAGILAGQLIEARA